MRSLFEDSELPIYTITDQIIKLPIQVKPSSAKTGIEGLIRGRLKISLTAHPQNGLANQDLIKYLAKILGIRKQDVFILKGLTTPLKLVAIPISAKENLDLIISQI
jgi:uncharacterized protein (TIGR00251 family)